MKQQKRELTLGFAMELVKIEAAGFQKQLAEFQKRFLDRYDIMKECVIKIFDKHLKGTDVKLDKNDIFTGFYSHAIQYYDISLSSRNFCVSLFLKSYKHLIFLQKGNYICADGKTIAHQKEIKAFFKELSKEIGVKVQLNTLYAWEGCSLA